MSFSSVSVVIPTAGRPTLLAAVSSVLKQTYRPLEVIVVFDCKESALAPKVLNMSSEVRVIYTGGIGSNGARMMGVNDSKGQLIAFLDDDDVWSPTKLEQQVAVWRRASVVRDHVVVSCRIAVIDEHNAVQKIRPSRLIGPDERVESYLFRCTSIRLDVGLLHTSSLICDRALIEEEPWDVKLSRHQDWDWVLRVLNRSDVALEMCPDVLVGVTLNSSASISMSSDWRASLEWLKQRAEFLTPRERGDFLLCCTAPIAIRSGSRRGGFIVAGVALRSGKPGLAAWLVWGIHMLSIDRASVIRKQLKHKARTVWTHARRIDGRRSREMPDAAWWPEMAASERVGATQG